MRNEGKKFCKIDVEVFDGHRRFFSSRRKVIGRKIETKAESLGSRPRAPCWRGSP